jgi:hypothetical protein
MTFDGFAAHFSLGLAGALILELFRLYEYIGKLNSTRFTNMVRSAMFWCVAVGMLVGSGIVTWLLFYGEITVSKPILVLVVGGSARSIFRQAVAARIAGADIKLGKADGKLQDIFL